MKKIFMGLLTFITMLALVGCITEQEDIKIAVIQGDPTEAQQALINTYLREVIAPEFNVEFIFSENIAEAAPERAFLEQSAAQGAKGVLSFVRNLDSDVFREVHETLGLYWMIFGDPQKNELDAWGDSEYFLGGIGQQQEEKTGMHNMTLDLLNQHGGDLSLLAFTGGIFTRNQMFIDRQAGIKSAIAEYEEETGKTVTYEEVDGFPNPDWFATAGSAVSKEPEIIISSAASSVVMTVINNVIETNSSYNPLFGANGSTDKVLLDAVGGRIDYLVAINPQAVAINFAIMYNYLTGHKDFITTESTVAQLSLSYTSIKTQEEAVAMVKDDFVTIEQLKSIMVEYNKDASYDDVVNLVKSLG